MINTSNIRVWNIAGAVYSARNAMNSWSKSDSDLETDNLGENDLKLAQRLVKAGSEHRKFMRGITVSINITAPLYWWKEFDTYKIGTVANSCSTMHKLTEREFTINDFSHDHMNPKTHGLLLDTIDHLNDLRDEFLKTKDYDTWYSMIQILPTSYEQMRTVVLNYEVVYNILRQRQEHKLKEWRDLCDILWDLPYIKEFIEG